MPLVFIWTSLDQKYITVVIIDVYGVIIFIVFNVYDIHICKVLSLILSVSVVEASQPVPADYVIYIMLLAVTRFYFPYFCPYEVS